MSPLKTGAKLHGFTVLKTCEIPEYRSRGFHLSHDKTGAEVFHVFNDDPENLFSFNFKTPPTDSTGVAHILEHSVLCGSQNYPIKDPFVYMIKSSLKTFLNAMTYPDKTLYPASSIVAKDYFNLMRVYGDAVFFPLLSRETFLQEGHRLEFDEAGKLILTGVVYNEMKGNYSSVDSLMFEQTCQSLFADGPYSHDSGGDPARIPDLTYEQFVDFHRNYYHPSNCQVFLYGNIPTDKQLAELDKLFFSKFERGVRCPDIVRQKRRTEPVRLTKPFPVGEGGEAKPAAGLAWLAADILDRDTTLRLDILSELLLGDAGVLQKALIDSGLGEDLSPVSGFMGEIRDTLFLVGLRGVSADKREAFEALVQTELERYAHEGLPADLVEGVLAAYEFSVREVKAGGMGRRLMSRSLLGWLHGAAPEAALAFAEPMARIRSELAAGQPVFETLIRQYLLDNPHRSSLYFQPDEGLQAAEAQALEAKLAAKLEQLSEAERQAIRKQSEALEAHQSAGESAEAQASLPALTLADIPAKVEHIAAKVQPHHGLELITHEGFTNGIAYVDLAFDLAHLSLDDYKDLLVFKSVIDRMGTKTLDYELLARRLQLTTGGVNFRASADTSVAGRLKETFWVRLKMLSQNIPAALDLLGQLLTAVRWDDLERLEDLVVEQRNEALSSLVPDGIGYAFARASSGLTVSGRLNEQLGGLSAVEVLRGLLPENEAERRASLQALSQRLSALAGKIFQRSHLAAGLTGESAFLPELKHEVTALLERLPERPVVAVAKTRADVPAGCHEVYKIPATVGFSALAVPASRLGQAGHPAELLLAHHLGTGYLWEHIRMKGGAYGAFADANPFEGIFGLMTYRDPNLLESLEHFRKALEEMAEQALTAEELELDIIGTVGSELRPRSAGENGYLFLMRHNLGVTDHLRQSKRDALLGLKPADIQAAAKRLLANLAEARTVSLTGPAIIEKARETVPGLDVRDLGL